MKILNDSVYGPVVLEPVNWLFIDTPAFQRLRNIAQLGMTSWVYPTADHHRFEHSIGTAYLAGKLVRQIRQTRPDLKVTDEDVMCAELAGLLHDIGHGPFSHCWDADVLPALEIKYPHEKASIDIIDWLLQQNDGSLQKKLKDFKLDDNHVRLIKEMIYGVLPENKDKLYKSDNPKSFIYDVVSNSFCGMDVDKLDYLGRDGESLGTVSLHKGDLERIILTATVNKVGGGHHIVWRDVTASSLHNVFQLRHRLHCIAYKHKTTVSIQQMFSDAMNTAGMKKRFSKIYDTSNPEDPRLNVAKFLQLTDTIFWDTLYSEDEDLSESRKILERIATRDLYLPLSSLRVPADHDLKKRGENQILEELKKRIRADGKISDELRKECESAIIIKRCTFTFGSTSTGTNPLDVLEYKKQSGDFLESSNNCHVSYMFSPKHIAELDIRLYSRTSDTRCNDELRRIYKDWAEETAGKEPLNY